MAIGRLHSLLRVLLIMTCIGLPVQAMAAELSLTPVVDTSTPIPGAGGDVSTLTSASIRNGKVVFDGFGSTTGFGVYSAGGGLSVIANLNTPIPSGTGNFNYAGNHSFDGTDVVFWGTGFGPASDGIFSTVGGLHTVANTMTQIPARSPGTMFSEFEIFPRIDNGTVVFKGLDSIGRPGVYVDDGMSLTRYADRQTAAPDGSGNYFNLSHPNIEDGRVGFVASTSTNHGIFSDLGTGLAVQADINTPMPGGPDDFGAFLTPPLMDDGNIAFFASASNNPLFSGIYANFGSGLSSVVDSNTAMPGGVGTFADLLGVALSGETVAFWSRSSSGQEGIYYARDGAIHPVIEIGDTINGNVVTVLNFYSEGLDGDQLAFAAGFGGPDEVTTTAIYVTTIPEPISLGLLLAAGALVRPRRRRSGE